MQDKHLLLFSSDPKSLSNLPERLQEAGFHIRLTKTMERASQAIADKEFDLVILDAGRQERQERELLLSIKSKYPDTEVIILAPNPSVDRAVNTMKAGAYHFQPKPCSSHDLVLIANKAMEKRILRLEVRELRTIVRRQTGPRLTGNSPRIQELKKIISRLAPLDCTVLIRGETGTGKELVSRIMHQMSPRGDKKFLAVNCGALSEDLLRNELFGHEKGAFTGATGTKTGIFEAASGGTILLDEIGDMPLAMQVQLLRVLQEKTIIRVGGVQEIPVDVRVLAATNRSLQQEVKKGFFREDLYYRLNIFPLRIPPLRDRLEDVPLFCQYFLEKYGREFNKNVEKVSDEVMDILTLYTYPGNVRELENIIERAIILTDTSTIELSHLPQRITRNTLRATASRETHPTLAQLEREHIQTTLQKCDGNRTLAAKMLGIDRVSLWRKLKKTQKKR